MRLKTFNEVKLRHLLMHVAVEYLSEFRKTMSNDYGHVIPMVATDYEAMYAYKCGRFEQCFCICQEIVTVLWQNVHISAVRSFYYPSSELIHLMDDVSFYFSLLTLVYQIVMAVKHMVVYQLPLSLYLMTECQLKLKLHQNTLIDSLRRIICVCKLYKQAPAAFAINVLLLTAVYRRVRRTLTNFSSKTL
jgi:hypothetical protein